MPRYILAIDQGTTSSRAMLFDQQACVVAKSQQKIPQKFPQKSWVEHDPEDIWQSVLLSCRALFQSYSVSDVAGLGITNQRETTIIWERTTGKPIYPAIVWQDRRTVEWSASFKKHEQMIQEKTGLLLDPYFSASKIAWILAHVPHARKRAEQGELAFGTVDTFLLWRLTQGKVHATDVTNASRTLLFNLETQSWDQALLDLFDIPRALLPDIADNAADFGETEADLFGAAIPIRAMMGDQQAASFGQACFGSDAMKCTYGTGAFILLNTGEKQLLSADRLLTTVAYRINGSPRFALEGSIFMAGAIMQWLRDNLGIIENAADSGRIAASLDSNGGVYLIPAFSGLGAPYWRPELEAAILGMTRDTTKAHIIRASLEAVAYRTKDLMLVAERCGVQLPSELRVDGGMSADDWFLQFLADILQMRIVRSACLETTDLGVAYMAGLQCGFYTSLESIAEMWRSAESFEPQLSAEASNVLYQAWLSAVKKLLG